MLENLNLRERPILDSIEKLGFIYLVFLCPIDHGDLNGEEID